MHFLTHKQFETLKQQLTQLITTKYKKLNEGWRLAVAEGDDRETDALSVATTLLFNHHHTVLQLRDVLDNVKIIKPKSTKRVEIGSIVTIKRGYNVETYEICDPIVVDASTSKISYLSPLGKALLHRRIETYQSTINEVAQTIEILKISPTTE